ncbi:ABC transporter ATP-binding protein [Pseudomonas asiatica]|uniref:ABC transporter ATP-binding protein n=1 Tax=Pseudomonas asiatica TaxID=2219225 RepID=UPI00383B85EB
MSIVSNLNEAAPLLDVSGLITQFPNDENRMIQILRGVSFQLGRGEVLGLVGESGSGKSVTGFSIMNLIEQPATVSGGSVRFAGEELVGLGESAMRSLRGRKIAMIFQDPMMTLNPVLRIDTQMIETLQAHETISREEAWKRSRDALALVGIPRPEERLSAYPHEFSGGMRQRVAIAIAMLHNPDLIIADEPTTALDVTVQSQIIAELVQLTRKRNMSMIWISHDLAIVSRLADRVAVMYAGQIVEMGSVHDVINNPQHPYTLGLIRSVPSQSPHGQRLQQIPGIAPRLDKLPQGCAFRPRCERASEQCQVAPELNPGQHQARCFHPTSQSHAASSASH